jgi:Protein of unknown function (DUF2891)
MDRELQRALVGAMSAMVLTGPGARTEDLVLDAATASRFAKLPLKCVRQQYPNKLDHVMGSAEEVKEPKVLHPAFYGCFDWHSSVHGHWMMARLLRRFPALAQAPELRGALDESLTAANIAVELTYFNQPNRKSFERTYGWAWLLKLQAELLAWGSPEAKKWAAALGPLAERVSAAYLDFLPRQTYPIRTGVHPNTAYGMSLALDYAHAAKDDRLRALVAERAQTYYGNDKQAPIQWEPGGEDFLSPALEEAALMSKVLPAAAFKKWLTAFLPGLMRGGSLQPAHVSDRTDPKIVHLDGLNLSRARALYTLAAALGKKGRRPTAFVQQADAHGQASLPHIASGSYEGEHWLATFAVQMLDARGSD